MYIKGTGMTTFNYHERPSHLLAYDAILQALNNSSMKIKEIDAIVISNLDFEFNGERQRHFGSLLSSLLKTNVPIIRVPAACSGGGAAAWTALKLKKKFDNVLAVATDKITSMPSPIVTQDFMTGGERLFEQPEGLNFPSQNALVAQQHMLEYGTTEDDFALISYKNHKNGCLNPKAKFYKKDVSLETIKKSPVVASPLRLFDCSISVDGAAAVVLTNDKTDVKVIGHSLMTDYISPIERESLTEWPAMKLAASEAFSQAGIGPGDIDIAEIHDAFTIVELLSYEDLGFCKKGEGKNMIRDGIVEIDGKLPVNPCGGLKAKGHPISPTGIAQIIEVCEQLRNESGDRQVSSPKYGLAQNIGGAGGTITVHIMKKVGG